LPVTPDDVRAAAAAIRGAVLCTPCTMSRTLSEITGAELWCKFENLQYTASFKERGALNFLLSLGEDERARGVVAASAGNHAQGVSYHARRLGIAATVVMPEATPFTKLERAEHLGAHIVLHGDDFTAALAEAKRLATETHATFVPAFDHPLVIAGQGTVGLEMLDAVPDLDAIVVPAGGGGLVAGIAVAVKDRAPNVEIVAAQSAHEPGLATALGSPVERDDGPTIAEGVAVRTPGELTVAIAREHVDRVVVVHDDTIEQAMALGLEIEKTVMEGAGAVALAAVLAERDRFADRRVGVVISGGNVDLRVLSSVILRALARSGRLVRLHIVIPDRPGELARVSQVVGDAYGNILDVVHHRDVLGVPVRETRLELSLEVRGREHADAVVSALRARHYDVEIV
jgi:threonine dehydratase